MLNGVRVMKRWSSLQRELYKIVDDKIDFQIHIALDRMDVNNSLARYWITIGAKASDCEE